METKYDPSPGTVARCANEIHAFFLKNAALVSADLDEILR